MAKKGTLFGKPRNQVIKHPGVLRAKAKAKHETVHEMVTHPPRNASKSTKKQIGLAKAFETMRAKKAAKGK